MSIIIHNFKQKSIKSPNSQGPNLKSLSWKNSSNDFLHFFYIYIFPFRYFFDRTSCLLKKKKIPISPISGGPSIERECLGEMKGSNDFLQIWCIKPFLDNILNTLFASGTFLSLISGAPNLVLEVSVLKKWCKWFLQNMI